jgi:hypothetical protein
MRAMKRLAGVLGGFALAGFTATAASAAVVSFDGQGAGPQTDYVESGFVFDTARLVNGNCESNATRPCLALNDNETTMVTTESGIPFNLNSFWFQFLGQGSVNNLTLIADGAVALVLSVAEFDHNDGGQVMDLTGNPAFQNISKLTFSTDGGGNVRIDDIDLTPIPLPGALPLMATALAGLGLALRKRKSSRA